MTRRHLIILLLAFLITRTAIVGAGVVAIRYYPSTEGSEFTHLLDGGAALDMWYRQDAGFYTSIATFGYDWINERQPADDMAFLPLYPLAIHLVGGMTESGCLASPYLSTCASIGGLIVSNAALLGALFLLYDLARRRFGDAVALAAALLLLVSPISIFLSGIYTESLFLLLTLLTFWLLERNRFGWAVAAACLACLTRSVGVALVPALLWTAWTQSTPSPTLPRLQGRAQTNSPLPRPQVEPTHLRTDFQSWNRLVLALLPALIFGGYILIMGVSVGDPLAYFHTYSSTWGRAAGTPIQAFTAYFSGDRVSWVGWELSWIDLGMALFYLALAAGLLRREATRAWGWFALTALLIPIATGSLLSMPRFGAALFPFYILLARWADRPYKQVILYGGSAALALLFIARFVTWRWIA